jgi:2-hydroxy-3-keto-5-methylthiopentenyl-1-phosphate phosphatase
MNKLKIFCDFDGTITAKDVWVSVGEYFIKNKDAWKQVISQFENLEIGAKECFLKECSLIEDFDKNIFDNIIDSQQIDPYFGDFMDFCNESETSLTILSEGMDYYIDRILSKNGYLIRFFANRFILLEDKRSFRLEFPYSDEECQKCVCCKRNLLMNLCSDDKISVFIGDGFSDACVVNYSDIVFAKKSLASYCWKNNITYFDYDNFGDVKKKIEKLLLNKSVKQKQTAKLMRRNVLLQG